jgi:hypothetical protein
MQAYSSYLETAYRVAPNAVLAWGAFQVADKLGHPTPPWVTEYFRSCVSGIEDLETKAKSNAVSKALGFAGGGKIPGAATTRMYRWRRDVSLFLYLHIRRGSKGIPEKFLSMGHPCSPSNAKLHGKSTTR